MDAYFNLCSAQQVFPDEAGLILYLGISEERYGKYIRAELRRYRPYQLCLERARLRRESILVRDIYAAEKRAPVGKLFLVKQEENGGLSDKYLKGAVKGGGKNILEVKMKSGAGFFE